MAWEESGIARDPAGGDAVHSVGGVLRIFVPERLLRSSAAACAVLSVAVLSGLARFAHASLPRADPALRALSTFGSQG